MSDEVDNITRSRLASEIERSDSDSIPNLGAEPLKPFEKCIQRSPVVLAQTRRISGLFQVKMSNCLVSRRINVQCPVIRHFDCAFLNAVGEKPCRSQIINDPWYSQI